ncbi:MAG: glycosyltransferase family 2 protein [Ferruginibacter sp.]
MSLSIIIVNYKTATLTLDCLSSIYKFDTGNIELIVVDNNSDDSIESMLHLKYPAVRFLQTGYNAGFARANNAGIRIAKGDVVLLLNSDTINIDNAINHCYEKLLNSPFIAASVQLLNEDKTPQISGNYAMKGGLNYLLPLPYTGVFLKWIAGVFKIKKPNVPDAKGLVEVDWINGAFLMVKKEAIDAAGLLDEDFFLYAEEAEWCSRLKKVGGMFVYGDDHVIHLQGESSGTAFNSDSKGYFNLFDKKGMQIMLSNFVRIKKQFGVGWLFFDLMFYYLTIPIFFIAVFFSSTLFPKTKKYTLKQAAGFCYNMFKMPKYILHLLSGKPFFYKVL